MGDTTASQDDPQDGPVQADSLAALIQAAQAGLGQQATPQQMSGGAKSLSDLVSAANGSKTDETDEDTDEDDQDADGDEGRGSKRSVLADLAKERDSRQQLESQFNEMKELLGKALGFVSDDGPTDEASRVAIETAKAEARDAQLQLAVVRNAPDTVDVSALLDSTAFARAIKEIDPADSKAVTKAVKDFVTDHPRFSKPEPAPQKRGTARDAGARQKGQSGTSMDDLIRGLT